MHYVRARWYDPKSGTWLSVDPVEAEPRYSYVHQMPTTHVDPSGRQGLPDTDSVISGIETIFDSVSKLARFAPSPLVVPITIVPIAVEQYRIARSAQLDVEIRLAKAQSLAQYSHFYNSVSPLARKLLPSPSKPEIAEWISKLDSGFKAGFLKEAANTLTGIVDFVSLSLEMVTNPGAGIAEISKKVTPFVELLVTEVSFFHEYGFTWDTVLSRYAYHPLASALESLIEADKISPYPLGELMGAVAFQILLAVILEGLTAGAETGYFGARVAEAVARTKSEIFASSSIMKRDAKTIVNKATRSFKRIAEVVQRNNTAESLAHKVNESAAKLKVRIERLRTKLGAEWRGHRHRRSPEEWHALAWDPATKQLREDERYVIATLEDRGVLKNKMVRDPSGKGDYKDSITGQLFDIWAPRYLDKSGAELRKAKRGAFDPANSLTKVREGIGASPPEITIIDVTHLNSSRQAALTQAIQAAHDSALLKQWIIWYK